MPAAGAPFEGNSGNFSPRSRIDRRRNAVAECAAGDRRRAADGVARMIHFSPATGVVLSLDDHGYALAALSWWWSTRCAPRGVC